MDASVAFSAALHRLPSFPRIDTDYQEVGPPGVRRRPERHMGKGNGGGEEMIDLTHHHRPGGDQGSLRGAPGGKRGTRNLY